MRREPLGVVAASPRGTTRCCRPSPRCSPPWPPATPYVLKPAETTPYSTAWLAEIVARVLPDGVFNVVFGTGAVAGDALARHPEVDVVSFTGSIDTGRKVGIAAADGVKKAIMELGGNSPVHRVRRRRRRPRIRARCDRAGGLYNTGQECMSASRVIVHASLLDAFVDGLKQRCGRENVSVTSSTPTTTVGPMNSAQQRDRVLAKIDGLQHRRPRGARR